jgi:hypothetical protein
MKVYGKEKYCNCWGSYGMGGKCYKCGKKMKMTGGSMMS